MVSISEKGLLGRHNARELEAGSSRVTEAGRAGGGMRGRGAPQTRGNSAGGFSSK